MRIAFDASVLARALAKFSPEEVDGMQLVVDTATRSAGLEVIGHAEAKEFLEYHKANNRYMRKQDVIEWAGALILEIEAERKNSS